MSSPPFALMTVTYSDRILTATRLGAFSQLLFMWKGSVYKLVYVDLLAYLFLYFSISCVYRFALDDRNKSRFEEAAMFCNNHSSLIPLTFVLAFYVSHVVSRWWAQWNAIPWPDGLAFKINCYCGGFDERTRLVRRSVTRYACLAIIETLRMISSPVKKRFPTYGHLKEAGLLTEDEMHAILNAQSKSDFLQYVYWIPLNWASSLTVKAYEEGLILKARYVSDINDELAKIRVGCGTIISYDWVSLPLVYTQVVTLAVYTFFGATLLGRQWLDPKRDIKGYERPNIDYVVPFFTVLQFLFYVGWLKVAEALLNPYGEDDEDFDTNYMVDRHLQISYMMVDLVGQHPPKVQKDMHWDVCVPEELPYTVASLPFRLPPAQTSAEFLSVPLKQQQPIYPQQLDDNGIRPGTSTWRLNAALTTILTPMLRRRKASQTLSTRSMTLSTKSMPNKDENQSKSRRITTISLSPRIGRRMLRSRSPSSDSLPTIEVTEPISSRSRKSSTNNGNALKPPLSPVWESKS